MAAINDPSSLPAGGVSLSTTPHPPSPVEAKYFYYGLPSRPLLVARSSTNVWSVQPEAYPTPKGLRPVGLHPLQEIWEATVGPAICDYLDSKKVKWTSVDTVRIGHEGDPSPPAIVWIGVFPDSLSAEDGIKIATHCKSILFTHGIDDVHVEIRESILTGPKVWGPAY